MKMILPVLLLAFACSQIPSEVKIQELESNTSALLQAISIVNKDVAWVSGHEATFARTLNGGSSWELFRHPDMDSLQFRDIHGIDEGKAILMSAGPGALSRIFNFSVENGWDETYVMDEPEGFLNTIEFWDNDTGLAFGDSFNEEFFILKTIDGGNTWKRIDPSVLPPSNAGEGGFAASGTCIATKPDGMAWIGTGAGGNSQVLHTTDYGQTWQAYTSPLVRGKAAGITSIRMATKEVGTIVGGNLEVENAYTANLAYTNDAGKTWNLTGFPKTKGAFYGSAIIPVKESVGQPAGNTIDIFFWIACGPNGIDYSYNMGKSWENLDTLNLWAVDMHVDGFGYAAGKYGNLVKIELKD